MPDPFGLLGQVIDAQLRVDSFVADGETSVVYRAQHLGGGPVALKCLKVKPDAELLQRLRERFWEVCNTVDSLAQEDPGVCRVLASGVTSSPGTGRPVVYMALEWLDGQSLTEDFRARRAAGMKGRSWGEVHTLFSSAAGALARAHTHGIVHRDVTPSNLFLHRTASGVRLRVLDFGVARILDDEGATGDTKSITHTPFYAAPEVFESRLGRVGPWTDVYSFALVLLEAARDERVRQGRTYADIAHEIMEHKRVPSPRALGMSVTDPLETLFASALALDTTKRPKDVGELWTRLRRALGLSSIIPPRPSEPVTRRAPEESGFTMNMPSPSKLPEDVKQYLERPQRPPLATPTQAFDDERTIAVDAPPTLDQLPNSMTPAIGIAMSAPTAPRPAPELSTLAVTDSALISIESQPHPSDAMDRTLTMKDAPPRPSPPAETLPFAATLAAPAPAPAPAPAFVAPPAPPPAPTFVAPPVLAPPGPIYAPPTAAPLPPKTDGRTWLWLAIVILAISLIGAGAAAAMLLQAR